VYEALLDRAAARAGMPDEYRIPVQPAAAEGLGGAVASLVGKLQRQLSWLAARSGLDELTIGLIFRDVAAYLSHPEVRDAILSAVMETLPSSGRTVLVSHSLGTVVAMDLLTRLDTSIDVPHLVTVGSPLGMDAVYDRLLVGGPRRPARVSTWLNAWCPADAVAIGCPLIPTWGQDLTEIVTDNNKDRAHSIEEYLGNPTVARSIKAALTIAAEIGPELRRGAGLRSGGHRDDGQRGRRGRGPRGGVGGLKAARCPLNREDNKRWAVVEGFL
jgi:hypothetical protein